MTQAGVAADDGDGDDILFARITRRFVPFLFVCYVIAQVDRMNVGFAKLTMLADLGFSEVVYGIGAGTFFIGYVLFEVPSNFALRRFGAPGWIGRIMITWGFLSIATLFVATPRTFYVVRTLLGVAEAGFFPGVIYWLTEWFPAHRRTRITAYFMSAIAVSGVLVGPVSGWLLGAMNGLHGLAGWQWLFLLEGAPSIVLGVAALFLLDRSPGHAMWLNCDERHRVQSIVAAEQVSMKDVSPGSVAVSPRVWMLSLIYGCYGMSFFGFVFWLPTIVGAAGVRHPLHIGLLTSIPWLAGAMTMIGTARHVSRGGDVRRTLITMGLLSTVGWIASPATRAVLPLGIAALSLGMAGLMGSLPVFWNLATRAFKGAAAATEIAMISALGNVPGFISPIFVGWVKEASGSLALPMYVFGGVMAGAAALVALLPAGNRLE